MLLMEYTVANCHWKNLKRAWHRIVYFMQISTTNIFITLFKKMGIYFNS
jgi:hypothetical protein